MKRTTTRITLGTIIISAATLLAFNAFAHKKSPTPTPTPGSTATPAPLTFALSDLSGTYTFRVVPVVSFAPWYDNDAVGEPDSGVNTAPRQDILRVGVITFDGHGNVTGHALATTDNGKTTVVLDFNFTGTCTVNTDGTGTLSITPSSGTISVPGEGTVEGAETYSFVINRGGGSRPGTVDLAETDNVGGGAKIFLTGKAVSRSESQQNEGDGDSD
jgi:hypothetical protein